MGGLVGKNQGILENIYSIGKVKGNTYVGGLVASNYGEIINAYSISAVSGSNDLGGMVGKNYKGGTIENSYWTEEKAGVATSNGGTKLTLEQMKTQLSYEEWNFEKGTIWVMKEYPELIEIEIINRE